MRQLPKVLFVDDDRFALASLHRMFRKEDIMLFFARDGDRALHIIEQDRPHIVVSDVWMPDMCGTELMAAVRDCYPGTGRIMLTGDLNIEVAMDAINDCGVYRLFEKPYDERELKEAILELVDVVLESEDAQTAQTMSVGEYYLRQIGTIQRNSKGAVIVR